MHSKQTVRYICEEYPSGNRYYYKQELITHGSWSDPSSLAWGRPRPITEATFEKQKKAGFQTEHRLEKKLPADIICLADRKNEQGREKRGKKRTKPRRRHGERSARARLLLRHGM